jgi:transcriptional regulator with XRE-family HTH domain
MAINAHFETGTRSKRGDERRTLLLDAEGTPPSGKASQVLIHNLSATGLLIECEMTLTSGETIAIDLPEAGSTEAHIIWSSGRLHGCAFEEPLGKAALSAAELRSAVEGSTRIAPPDHEPLAMRLQRLRAERGMSLSQLASMLGVSKPTVWAWEQGRSRPADKRIAPLADALGVDVSDLIPVLDTPALQQLLTRSRARIAEAFGCGPDNVRIMIEL